MFQECAPCDCDLGGSESLVCDKGTGQCPCKPEMGGRRCNVVMQGAFVPTFDYYSMQVKNAILVDYTYNFILDLTFFHSIFQSPSLF